MKENEEQIREMYYTLNAIKIESEELSRLLEDSKMNKFELKALSNYLKEVEEEIDSYIQDIRNNIAWDK